MFRTACNTARRSAVVAMVAGGLLAAGAGAALAAQPTATPPAPSLSNGSSGITMIVNNTTDDTMTLTSATNSYGHWQHRPTDIAGPGKTVASNYSDDIEGSLMDLQFTTPNGTLIDLTSDAPLAGPSWASASVTGPGGYKVTWTHSGSFHTTDIYTVSYG